MNNTAHKKSARRRLELEAVVPVLMAGFLAALPAGRAQPAGPVAQAPGPLQAPVLKPRELMIIEVTQTGEIAGAWIGSVPVSRERYSRPGRPIRQYQVGTARIADPAHPSGVCIWDESTKERTYFCWPNDRHAWIQLTPGMISSQSRLPSPDAGNITQVYYQSDREKRSARALAPLGTPTPIPGKVLSYQQLLDDPCLCCWVAGDGSLLCINLCELT